MRALSAVLALATTACGSEDHAPADAGLLDAIVDAPASGLVTYACVGGQGFCPPSDVVFQESDGAVIAIETMGGNVLSASAVMAPGGYVTVLEPNSHLMYTFGGVDPGDVLYVHLLGPEIKRPVDVTVPTAPGLGGYSLGHNCRPGGTPYVDAAPGATTVTLHDDYLSCDRTDMVIGATNEPFNGASQVLVALDVPVSPTMTLSGTYQALIDVSLTITGLPPDGEAWGSIDLYGPHGIIGSNGAAVGAMRPTAQLAIPGFFAPTPRLIAGARIQIVDAPAPRAQEGQGTVLRWAPYDGPTTVDASHRHRRIASSSYDAATRTYRWTEQGPGAAPHFFTGSLDFPFGSPNPTTMRWFFTGAATSGSFTLPPLPLVRNIDWGPPADGAGVVAGRPVTYRLETTIPDRDAYDLGRPWVFSDLGSTRIFGSSGELTIER